MALAAEANGQFLELARRLAYRIAQERGVVSIEDIRDAWPYQTFPTGNWCGSIFKGGDWEPVGIIQAGHVGSHGRWIRTWRLKKARFVKNLESVPQVASPVTERQRPLAAATQAELFYLPQTPWD